MNVKLTDLTGVGCLLSLLTLVVTVALGLVIGIFVAGQGYERQSGDKPPGILIGLAMVGGILFFWVGSFVLKLARIPVLRSQREQWKTQCRDKPRDPVATLEKLW